MSAGQSAAGPEAGALKRVAVPSCCETVRVQFKAVLQLKCRLDSLETTPTPAEETLNPDPSVSTSESAFPSCCLCETVNSIRSH